MRSDALPPARNNQNNSIVRLFEIVGLLVLALSLPWFTGCSAANSAMASSSGHTAQPQPRQPQHNFPRIGELKLSAALPTGQVGSSFTASIEVTGGKSPYQFSISWGALPQGLSLDKSSGAISGTPTKGGSFGFGVHVTDSAGASGASPFQISVSDSSSIVVTLTPATTTVQSAGTAQFTAAVSNTSNTAVTWSTSDGAINASGLYKAPNVTTNTRVTITAVSNADASKSGTATVTVTPASQQSQLTVTTTGLTGITSGVTYAANLKASGGTAPYSWSMSSGTLPSGIGLQSAGSISGTTTQTGQYSFVVMVSDSSSPKQTATQSLALTVSNPTTGGNTIPTTFFGADFNGAAVWPPTDGQNQIATLGGVRLWDDGIKWGQLNTANGVYNWTGLDNWFNRAQGSNMDVLYTFGDTPQFAAGATAPAGCLQPGIYSCAAPTDVNADGTGTDAYFSAFVTALVTHAAGRIAYYELWNEPDCTCFWSGTQAQLVRMGKDAAAIIRSLDPNAKILSPSAHGPTMATWFDGYIAAGGAPNFDIVNVHMRGQNGTNQIPESFLTVWGQVTAETQKRSLTGLPVWDDEHGILQNQGLTDPDMLAGYVARSAMLRAGVGIQRQYIYTWDSHAPYGLQGSLSGTAWDQVATWLIGHTASACTTSGTVYTCNLDNGLVVWDTAQSCGNGVCTTVPYTTPSSYSSYLDLDGNKTTISGNSVQVGYKPILLQN